MILKRTVYNCSAPQDGESQQQSNKTLAELQARKNAIDIVGAVCRIATDMLHRGNSMPPEIVTRILGSSHLFSSLTPMILAHIGPVASQDPRVSVLTHTKNSSSQRSSGI